MDDGWMVDDSDDHELINLGLISSWCLKLTSQDVRHPAKSVYCQTQLCRSQMSQVVPMPEPVANEVGSSDVWMKLMSLYWDKSWIPDNSRSFFIFFGMEWWFNFDLICWYSMSIVSAILLLVSILTSIVIGWSQGNQLQWLSLSFIDDQFPYFKQHNTCYMYIYIYTVNTFEYYIYTV